MPDPVGLGEAREQGHRHLACQRLVCPGHRTVPFAGKPAPTDDEALVCLTLWDLAKPGNKATGACVAEAYRVCTGLASIFTRIRL